MKYTFQVLSSGKKLIKAANGLHEVQFSICQYDDLIVGTIHLTQMPEAKTEQTRHLTGECPVEAAKEMQYWLEVDAADMITELSQESA